MKARILILGMTALAAIGTLTVVGLSVAERDKPESVNASVEGPYPTADGSQLLIGSPVAATWEWPEHVGSGEHATRHAVDIITATARASSREGTRAVATRSLATWAAYETRVAETGTRHADAANANVYAVGAYADVARPCSDSRGHAWGVADPSIPHIIRRWADCNNAVYGDAWGLGISHVDAIPNGGSGAGGAARRCAWAVCMQHAVGDVPRSVSGAVER